MWETIIICTIFGVFIFSAFVVGLHYGTKIKSNEKVEIPNPVKSITNYVEEKKTKQEIQRELEIEEINLYNIDAYDGTGLGQKDFPS